MTHHVFVDETKRQRYVIVAVYVQPRQLAPARKAIRELLLPGQRRLHFFKERDSRRRAVLSAICAAGIEARIYEGPSGTPMARARLLCMEALIQDVIGTRAGRLVMEREDSALDSDRQLIIERIAKSPIKETFAYEHVRPHEEGLLWIPDALAWAWSKGGDWRRRAHR